MRSRASLKGHPIHPALIPFPFAFLTGAVLFDFAGLLTGRASWWTTGGQLALAGIATALLAAVPGLMDYLYTVPPRSSGKRRATIHMTVMLTAVVLFLAAAVLRGGPATEPTPVLIGLQAAALGLLSVGGWMGGTLVSRNQISVDHRYAEAGKWNELTLRDVPDGPLVVATADELKVNQMKLLRLNDRRIVLARTEQGYVAFDDRCPHSGGSLAGGTMMRGTVQCPWHGSQFDVSSGALACGPATVAIRSYAVVLKGDEVRLKLD